MDNKNYVVIQGWMINNLDLDIKELFLFAIIYGFNQDKETLFKGSRKYMSKLLKCSLNTISNLLKNLLEKKLIIKHIEIINQVKFNSYSVNFVEIEKLIKIKKNLKEEKLKTVLDWEN